MYEDFSTPDEVKERRKAAGQDPQLGYDNYDRNLTEEQKEAYRAEGRQPVWRLRMPDEDITFNDLVRGEITFKAGTVPDYVVVRSNGDPLYTFVNPVDDALMASPTCCAAKTCSPPPRVRSRSTAHSLTPA